MFHTHLCCRKELLLIKLSLYNYYNDIPVKLVLTGFEMKFSLYDPTIQKIDVIRLEKRLDDDILYMRDALPEYYTYPLDMEPEILPEGSSVPVNTIKVGLLGRQHVLWGRDDCDLVETYFYSYCSNIYIS